MRVAGCNRYHAAGPYTPAYEDFYFHVSPGDPPPDSRQKAVGWAFPALFHVPDAATWVLLTESGTDESYCACHLNPDSSGGLYRIAFPLADETTQGYTNKFGPEPRYTLPWTMPWRVIVMGKSRRRHRHWKRSSPTLRRRRALPTRRGSNRVARRGPGGLIPAGRTRQICSMNSPILPPKWVGNIPCSTPGGGSPD